MWLNIRKAHTKSKEQWWWNPEVGQAIQEKKEAQKCLEEASEAEKTRLEQKYREKKNAANKTVAKARDNIQQEWRDRIEEDGGKKYIFQLVRDRDRDSKDTTRTSAMKGSDGTSAKCMGGVFQETTKPGGRM